MPPSVGDVIRATVKMSIGESDVQNVFHLQLDTVPGGANNEDLALEIADVMDALYDLIDTYVSEDVTFDTVECYNLTENEYVGEVSFPALTAGAATGITPPQLAPLVNFLTGTLRSLGKKFLPPMGEAVPDADGTIGAGLLAAMVAFAAEALAPGGFTNYGGDFGNFRPATATFIQWTAGIARDLFATQRRRYIGSGS